MKEKEYKCFDTGEIWTESEIKEAYDSSPELFDEYPTFEDYLRYLLLLGSQKVGGIIEVKSK